jgi:hypothetical protein
VIQNSALVTALALAALAAPLLATSGCAQPSSQLHDLLGGAEAHDLLLHPETATSREAWRIDGMAGWVKKEDDPRERFLAYPIISGPVPIDDASTATLSDVLTDDDTYLWDIAKACEFLPGVAFRFERDELQVDVLICFSCDELEVYLDGKEVGHEDFDPRRPDLVAVAKRLFPDDEAIQKLAP